MLKELREIIIKTLALSVNTGKTRSKNSNKRLIITYKVVAVHQLQLKSQKEKKALVL